MILVTLIVILIVTVLVKYFLHMRHLESYVKHLNIKRPVYPFIGNVLWLFRKSTTEVFREIMEYTKSNGTPYKSYIGPTLLITIDKPEDLKTILTSPFCLNKPFVYQFYPSPAGILTVRCKFFETNQIFYNLLLISRILFGKSNFFYFFFHNICSNE